MDTTRLCPQCQQPLSADAPDGLCPQCLMKAATGPAPSASGVGLPGDIIDIGDPAEVAKKLPQFEILELLGRGGMGVVYKARQLQLDRLVALKILPPVDALSPDFVARFTREARALAKLNHANIVNVYDFGETGGLYYIVMEYVDGANLRQLFEARKLTPAEALAIVPKICDALQYAHEEGLVHRDIKPENLLIDKKGRVKIADFGLAKLLRREPLDMTLTLSGMALGTLRYMAPEQMDKPETVDHRADLYSLGVVIYEMLTGETPVGRFELPSQKAQVDVRFDEIVLHALEREPDRRYQHASEVKTDVEKVAGTPQVEPAPVPPVPAIREEGGASVEPLHAEAASAKRPSRRHVLTAFLTLLFFATLIFAINFRATMSTTPAGRTSRIIIGTLDPLFVRESGPSGFHQHLQFFSWSFFALVVAGVAFGALWRVSREDEGKVARDPAWWRGWWKQVGIWGGLVLIACIVRTAMNPGALLNPAHKSAAAGAVSDKSVTYLDGHTSTVKALAVSPGGRTLASVGFDGRLIVRELPGGKVINTITAPVDDKQASPAALMSVAISPDNEQVFASGNRLLLARLRADKVARTIASSNGSITRITPFDGGRKLAYIGGGGSEIVFFDLAAQRQLKTAPIFPGKFFGNVRTSAASPDGRFIAVTSSDMKSDPGGGASSAEPCKLTVFDTEGVERVSWQFADYADFSFATMVFPDARSLAVCLPSGKMLRWTLDAGEQWQASPDPVRISPGRYTASTASRDGRVIWLAENRQIVGLDAGTGKGVAFVDLQIGERLGSFSAVPIEAIAATNEPNTIAVALWDGRVALAKCHPMATDSTKLEAAPAKDLRFSIQQDRSQLPATATPGRQDYAFKFSGPADHTLNVWMEVWQEGRMEWVSDFDFEAKPKAGEPLAASLTLTAMGGDAANKESNGKTRLDWSMNCGGSEGKSHTANALIADLSAGMGATYSTWDRQTKALNPRPGETVTVLGITGYKLSNFRSVAPAFTETDLLKRWPNAAVLIRARFSPARSGQLSDAVGLGTKVSDQAFERHTFAQFEISKQLGVDLSDCRTPAEAHAALVAAASTPDGKARAAQMVDEFGSDNISYVDQFRFAAEPMLAMWWKLRKKEPVAAEEVVGLLENFITAVNGPGSHGVQWNHGEPITKWAEGPLLNDSFAKKLKLTKLQIDEVNKLFKKYADEANALRRRHTKVTKNDQGHVLINIEPHSEECLELARKMVAELGGIVTQDIVPAVKVGALPMAIFGNAGECRETVVLKKDSDGVYVIRIITSDWVPAGEWRGDNTTGWGSKDIDLAFGSYKMYWTEE